MAESLARSERRELCELMTTVGPDAPTLCEGWTAHHLAAHLRMRESDPLGAIGMFLPFLGTTEKHMDKLMTQMSFDELVGLVAKGPTGLSPFRISVVDTKANTAEFFVHHEDLRRGGPYPVGPRVLPPQTDETLWDAAIGAARLRLRKAKMGIILQRVRDGKATDEQAVVATGRTPVTVTGEPGELLLWLFGREAAAQVQLSGTAEALARIRSISLSV